MKVNQKIFLGDLTILLFLVYMYLWRLGQWYSIHRAPLSLYFCFISIIFYLLLSKILSLNHWAVLLGTIVFAFCGSDLSLAFSHNKLPYPGILPFFIALFSIFLKEKKKTFLYMFVVITFLLASFATIMHLPVIFFSLMRLFFNLCFGIVVACGFNIILLVTKEKDDLLYRRLHKFLYKVWLYTLLIILPIVYTLLILFMEINKKLIPNIVSSIVLFELFLGWVLIISDSREKAISDIIPFITVFLATTDIFTHWTAI